MLVLLLQRFPDGYVLALTLNTGQRPPRRKIVATTLFPPDGDVEMGCNPWI